MGRDIKVDKCLGVEYLGWQNTEDKQVDKNCLGHLGRPELKTRRSKKWSWSFISTEIEAKKVNKKSMKAIYVDLAMSILLPPFCVDLKFTLSYLTSL
jgi:hypothetical protein